MTLYHRRSKKKNTNKHTGNRKRRVSQGHHTHTHLHMEVCVIPSFWVRLLHHSKSLSSTHTENESLFYYFSVSFRTTLFVAKQKINEVKKKKKTGSYTCVRIPVWPINTSYIGTQRGVHNLACCSTKFSSMSKRLNCYVFLFLFFITTV